MDAKRDFPFEFERKFLVKELPNGVVDHGAAQVIIQAYVFAEAGYAIRVRLQFRGARLPEEPFNPAVDELGAYERRLLAALIRDRRDDAVATIAVKSPSVSGERYEMETELDTDVAIQIIQRSARVIAKTRHSLWFNEDGWEFDVFAGQNTGLIVAEIERLTPVTNVEIPEFCVTEVTTDPRFTNDSLSKEPWLHWDALYMNELSQRGPYFLNLTD
ncbi:CYTH domain-containing protein [Trueperella bonasi]|uniref:CYTH domain-containing protein n=1 Tax=Trueperella bonasi TaxID=312286 RepID=A0ABT9NG54_9ACTO|nr:adenylate cyclase [Trueperella bonasi]MDP9806378.1 CYTH domain-containing protein [Trueperella bonasi]